MEDTLLVEILPPTTDPFTQAVVLVGMVVVLVVLALRASSPRWRK